VFNGAFPAHLSRTDAWFLPAVMQWTGLTHSSTLVAIPHWLSLLPEGTGPSARLPPSGSRSSSVVSMEDKALEAAGVTE